MQKTNDPAQAQESLEATIATLTAENLALKVQIEGDAVVNDERFHVISDLQRDMSVLAAHNELLSDLIGNSSLADDPHIMSAINDDPDGLVDKVKRQHQREILHMLIAEHEYKGIIKWPQRVRQLHNSLQEPDTLTR